MADDQRAKLLEALNALYHHPQADVRKEADKWLGDWQRTPHAWSTADSVLHDASSSMEAQYFCAQTLRTKVQRDFEELPPGAAEGLRDSLAALVLHFSHGSPPVRTQLCLALAALPQHLPAAQWGEAGLVPWFGQRLTQGDAGAAGISCLLEMLTVIPQEAGSYKAAIRPERRREYMQELMMSCPAALDMLSSCLQSGQASETNMRREILEAFGAWIRLCGGTGMEGAALAQHPLVLAALQSLESTDESFDAAVDALCELVWSCVAPTAQGMPPQMLGHMLPIVQVLVSKVFTLRQRFAVAAARARDENPPAGAEHWDDDEDTAKGMARCFAEIGEALVGNVIQAVPEIVPIVETLLDVAAYPEDSIAAISFNFWNSLAEGLAGAQVEAEEKERRRLVFVPAFETLVGHIRGRVRYPDDHDKMGKEERKEFKRSRYAIADTLVDAALVVGGNRILELMMEPLQEMSQAVASGTQGFDWRTAESALYCIRAVHRSAPTQANTVLSSLFGTVPQLPSIPGCSPQLLYTVALMVGAYADWLGIAVASQWLPASLLQQLMTMLTSTLSHSEAAPAGALAIRHVCDACRLHLLDCVPDLLKLYEAVVPISNKGSAAAAGSLDLDDEDVLQVIEGITIVVAALPDDNLGGALNALLGPPSQLLEAANSSLAPGASMRPFIPFMERLNTVFHFFKAPPPPRGSRPPAQTRQALLVAESLGRCWNLFETLLEKAKGDQAAMEAVCKAPRYALRTAGTAAAPLLPTILERLPQLFKATKQCTLLYVGSELVKTFGPDPANSDAVGSLFQGLIQEVLPHLSSLEGYNNDPDMADDAFLLIGRAISYCPAYVYRETAVVSVLLDTAMHGILVQQREACLSVLAFFVKLLDPGAMRRAADAGVAQAGPNLEAAVMGSRGNQSGGPSRGSEVLRLLLAGIVGGLPRGRVRDISDAMMAVLAVTQGQGMQWLMEVVNRLPESVATVDDKERFWKGVQTAVSTDLARAGSRSMEAALEEMSDLCRRNERVLGAAQQALLGGQ